jgi:hypothetical protein
MACAVSNAETLMVVILSVLPYTGLSGDRRRGSGWLFRIADCRNNFNLSGFW